MDFLEEQKNKKKNNEFISENIEILEKVKNQDEIDHIVSILETHFIFYNLEIEELYSFDQKKYCLEHEVWTSGPRVVPLQLTRCLRLLFHSSQRNHGSDHQWQSKAWTQVKRKILPNDGFGDLALLHNNPRTSSVRAVENCDLW